MDPGSSSWVSIPGATSAELRLTDVPLTDNGTRFRCVILDATGQRLVSETALLTVLAPLPPTGDDAQPALWLFLALAAVLTLAWCLNRRKERV